MHEIVGKLENVDGADLAWRRVEGASPPIVWLGGFKSDMAGTKATLLAEWAAAGDRDFLRFDYSGHGESDGAFEDGTIGRWRDDALAVIDALTEGPAVLVGSSMGGWIACLAALARPERVKALVLIAPAADFTDKLMWVEMDADIRRKIEEEGRWMRASPYDPAGYPITRALIEDGRRWNILDGLVATGCPVRILQGGADPDVPWRHALKLHEALTSEDKVFTLIADADHSLSRPQDMTRIVAAIEEVL
ncbi:MAG: alpha/beta fold hydrolase [Caulobacteraceae bacterium]